MRSEHYHKERPSSWIEGWKVSQNPAHRVSSSWNLLVFSSVQESGEFRSFSRAFSHYLVSRFPSVLFLLLTP